MPSMFTLEPPENLSWRWPFPWCPPPVCQGDIPYVPQNKTSFRTPIRPGVNTSTSLDHKCEWLHSTMFHKCYFFPTETLTMLLGMQELAPLGFEDITELIPSWELTYPTYGKKIIFPATFKGDVEVPWRVRYYPLCHDPMPPTDSIYACSFVRHHQRSKLHSQKRCLHATLGAK